MFNYLNIVEFSTIILYDSYSDNKRRQNMVCTIVSDKLEVNFIYKKHTQDIKKKITEMVWKMYCKGYDTFHVNCE